ncbi:MAG: hypothetical protein J5830_04215 [Clostridia bacterium]|nr:hypothetical protein [Clostridia bacterium]
MIKSSVMKRIGKPTVFIVAIVLLLLCGCSHGENAPYEPDTPEPAPHSGWFTTDGHHGGMFFEGDGAGVRINFDGYLSEKTGLPEGEHEGTYVFLSGDLPPHGSVPVRYDAAHELRLNIGDRVAVLTLGIVSEDGKTVQSGVGTVTPDVIPVVIYDADVPVEIDFVLQNPPT